MSRATYRLRFAPQTPCPNCGRKTKTVEGVCADCWATKEEGHRQFWGQRRGQGSPGWFFLDDLIWLPLVLALAVAILRSV